MWEERGEEFHKDCEVWGHPGQSEEMMVQLADELDDKEKDLQEKTPTKRKRKRGHHLMMRKRRKMATVRTTSSVVASQTEHKSKIEFF